MDTISCPSRHLSTSIEIISFRIAIYAAVKSFSETSTKSSRTGGKNIGILETISSNVFLAEKDNSLTKIPISRDGSVGYESSIECNGTNSNNDRRM